jgi:uracil-DNA glycosylase
MKNSDRDILLSALREYLEQLQETGVEGLPVAGGGFSEPATTCVAVREPVVHTAPAVVEHRVETLAAVAADLGDCQRCPLAEQRTNLVFGVGDEKSRIVFVGEAPGRDEDLQGTPFVGEAGQLLTKIIEAMGFAREEVYICNVLKCRPPNNRNPVPAEITACQPYLLRQVKAVAPEIIVALGTFAAQTLLATREPISKLRGRFHDYHGIPLMATFHPAYLLRNLAMKREVWDDMKAVLEKLGLKVPVPVRSREDS